MEVRATLKAFAMAVVSRTLPDGQLNRLCNFAEEWAPVKGRLIKLSLSASEASHQLAKSSPMGRRETTRGRAAW